jgi:hypothetical protein
VAAGAVVVVVVIERLRVPFRKDTTKSAKKILI